MITRGLGSGALITRGFSGWAFIIREIISLTSKLTYLATGTSRTRQNISKTSAIDKQNTAISKIDLEQD